MVAEEEQEEEQTYPRRWLPNQLSLCHLNNSEEPVQHVKHLKSNVIEQLLFVAGKEYWAYVKKNGQPKQCQ